MTFRTPDRPWRRPLSTAVILLLGVYKRFVSPFMFVLGARCRHAPTCSEYAAEAFYRHGPWAGVWLTVSRLSRCHPFGSSGWDPVPERLPRVGWRVWRLGDWAWTERQAPTGEADARPTPCARS